MSTITSATSSDAAIDSKRRIQPLRQEDQQQQQQQESKRNPEDLSGYSEEKIYLPSFATEQAMCGRYEYARQLYDSWIQTKCEPDDYRIYFNRAICNYELEDYDQALTDVNVAIRLKDKWPKGE